MSTVPQLDISSGLVGKASLSSAPDFLQPALVSQHTRMVPGDPTADSIAHVDPQNLSQIVIDRPKLADQATVNHEATHVYQDTLNKPVKYADENQPGMGAYDYGGWDGLRAAQLQHKTIRDFTDEQQAAMVHDFTDLKKYVEQPSKTDAESQKKAAEWDKATQAFGPYLRQLASQPHKYDPVAMRDLEAAAFPGSVLEKMNTTPAPPGPPPASVSGIAKPLPEWGGSTIDISAGLVKRDAQHPKSPVAAMQQYQASNATLQQVLKEYPGLGKNFNAGNTVLVFANPERSRRGLKERGGLEYWPSTEKGTSDFPSPVPGKNVLEIYSDELKNDPQALKQAVFGDLMHGMSNDPYWKSLRAQFMNNFTPQELKRQEQHKTWWEDVNGSKTPNGPTYDAYLRGWIANEGDGKKGQKESGNTMYSPKQIQILMKMQDYLKSGKAQ